jgi:hypothetical protein
VSLVEYQPDLEAIRRDVAALAAIERSSARPGERTSAAWLEQRLREFGSIEVELQPYRYQRTYALAHGLHLCAGIAAAWRGGLAGSALAAGALVSSEREVSGASQWLRRLLPGGEGANVIGRLRSRGRRRATLVLVAHHDAANTGLQWHPRIITAGARRHLRRRRVDPFMAPVQLAFGLAALGGLLPRRARAGRIARSVSGGLLAVWAAMNAEMARGPTVPGASDNATGVAVCLDLARALSSTPLEQVEVLIALTGSEEAGMGGMIAFLDRSAGLLDSESTLVLGLDTLGAGDPIVCCAEGPMHDQRYAERDVALVEEGAAAIGAPAPGRWRIGGWTDPIVAVHRGIPAASLLSMGPGYFPHYHRLSDTPENVDWGSVEACARIAAGTIGAFDRRVSSGGWA